MTKTLEARFKELGRQRGTDPIVVAKFFHPVGSWTWYATEYDPKTKICFGLVHGFEKEWGDFSLEEMEQPMGPLGLPCERDRFWVECRASQITGGAT